MGILRLFATHVSTMNLIPSSKTLELSKSATVVDTPTFQVKMLGIKEDRKFLTGLASNFLKKLMQIWAVQHNTVHLLPLIVVDLGPGAANIIVIRKRELENTIDMHLNVNSNVLAFRLLQTTIVCMYLCIFSQLRA